MTVCIAALCDNRKSILLVADRMIGLAIAEAELNIRKTLPLHPDWWVMLAGNGISPAFDVIDLARSQLPQNDSVTVETAMNAVTSAYERQRLRIAETRYLKSRGESLGEFRASGATRYPKALFREIDDRVTEFELPLTLLVAGFDRDGVGQVFTVNDPGEANRQDIPAFAAIGSGKYTALASLLYREVNPRMALHRATYFLFEAKIAGERASGVGFDTDLYLVRKGQKAVRITKSSESRLETIWNRLKPRELSPSQSRTLRRLPEIRRILSGN